MSKWNLASVLRSALREAWRNSPLMREALENAKEEYTVRSKHGLPLRRVHFRCAGCRECFKREEVRVDHIAPVVCPLTGFQDWDVYVTRLFCESSKLQVLCEACHDVKTAREKAVRTATRKRQVSGK